MKALIIGGSNGIGLAISNYLISKGCHVIVLDICEPSEVVGNCDYEYFNMLAMDYALLGRLAADQGIGLLMITAGIGRVAGFENLHISEINKLLTIDAVSPIEIIRIFYNRIKSEHEFFCGIMGSIAGLVSSPLFSVYAAAKAAVCRFVESVNIEIEAAGFNNRILNVSPGSIKGTRFNGGENNLEMTGALAEQIVAHLTNSSELFIPQYDEVLKSVIDRYRANPHEYGLQSYAYKVNSGRMASEKKVCIGYLSGTFDLFHIGHLNLLRRAKEKCDYLIVGVHDSGAWKGKETFIPLEERKAIVGACKYVDKVVDSCREDSDAWTLWHYDALFVGSDYKGTERFEKYEKFFADKKVKIIYFPYTTGTSSTQLRAVVSQNTPSRNVM